MRPRSLAFRATWNESVRVNPSFFLYTSQKRLQLSLLKRKMCSSQKEPIQNQKTADPWGLTPQPIPQPMPLLRACGMIWDLRNSPSIIWRRDSTALKQLWPELCPPHPVVTCISVCQFWLHWEAWLLVEPEFPSSRREALHVHPGAGKLAVGPALSDILLGTQEATLLTPSLERRRLCPLPAVTCTPAGLL